MNLLDENFPHDQALLLRARRVSFRRIGIEIGRLGDKESDIIPLLHLRRRVTFFTMDRDFFRRSLCHMSYCLAWLEVRNDDAADFVRRFLNHREFVTEARRMGKVARVHRGGVDFWTRHDQDLHRTPWLHAAF